MTGQALFILLPGVLAVAIAAFMVWVFARRYRRALGVARAEREKTTDTSFIINAFHEVTKQLKEKEKELERLKAIAEQHVENIESYNENILQCVTSGVMTFDAECRLTTINRVILAQRVPNKLVPHKETAQMRMSRKSNPHHIKTLALSPVGRWVEN